VVVFNTDTAIAIAPRLNTAVTTVLEVTLSLLRVTFRRVQLMVIGEVGAPIPLVIVCVAAWEGNIVSGNATIQHLTTAERTVVQRLAKRARVKRTRVEMTLESYRKVRVIRIEVALR